MHAPIITAGTLALLTLAGAALAGSAVAQSYGSQGQGWQQQQPAYGNQLGNQQGAPTGSYGQQGGAYDNQQQRDRDQYRQGAGPATQPGNRRSHSEQRTARGDLAVDVDTALQARGYDVGVIDGKLDAQSRAAIRGYERTAGLAITGEPSQALLTHIESHAIRAGNATPQSETLGSAAGQAVDRFLKPTR